MTSRDLLHKDKLEEFAAYCEGRGYIRHPTPPRAIYEVLRLEEHSPAGNNPHLVFYQRGGTDHITVPAEAILLVRAFIAARREKTC